MGIVSQLFNRGHDVQPAEREAPKAVPDTFAFCFDIETTKLSRLRSLGGDPGTHVSVGLRRYLQVRKGQPLPFEDLTGRLEERAAVTSVNWIVPSDLRSALPWSDSRRAGMFIRAALREYLEEFRTSLREPPRRTATMPPPPVPAKTIAVDITVPLWDRVKALGRPYGKHVEAAVRKFLKERSKWKPETMARAGVKRSYDELACAETTITWTPPPDLENVTLETVRAALRLCLKKPRW